MIKVTYLFVVKIIEKDKVTDLTQKMFYL